MTLPHLSSCFIFFLSYCAQSSCWIKHSLLCVRAGAWFPFMPSLLDKIPFWLLNLLAVYYRFNSSSHLYQLTSIAVVSLYFHALIKNKCRGHSRMLFLLSLVATKSHRHSSGTFKVLSPLMVFRWPGHCLYAHKLWAGNELGPVKWRYSLKPCPLSQAICSLIEQSLLLRSTYSWRLRIM